MGFKKCPKCGIMLSYSKFGCNKARKSGLQPYCVSCMRKARKKNSKTEKAREKARERQKRYRERLKEKKEKKSDVKVSVKTPDSITNGSRNHNEAKISRNQKIVLNPQPIKRSRG